MAREERTTSSKNITDEFIDEFGHLISVPVSSKSRRKTKPEGTYTTKLVKGFEEEPDGACDKIPDPMGTYKTTPRPFDCFATLSGRCVVFEAKYFNEYQAIGMRHLRDKQKIRLNAYHNAGALACVVVFYKVGSRVRMVVVRYSELAATGTIKKRVVEAMPFDVVKGGVFPVDQFRALLDE